MLGEFDAAINKVKIADAFGRFFYDRGLDREARINKNANVRSNSDSGPVNWNLIRRDPVKIFTRKAILRLAASEILQGKNVGFVNFDIKDLRKIDVAGYGEVLLHDFVEI